MYTYMYTRRLTEVIHKMDIKRCESGEQMQNLKIANGRDDIT